MFIVFVTCSADNEVKFFALPFNLETLNLLLKHFVALFTGKYVLFSAEIDGVNYDSLLIIAWRGFWLG